MVHTHHFESLAKFLMDSRVGSRPFSGMLWMIAFRTTGFEESGRTWAIFPGMTSLKLILTSGKKVYIFYTYFNIILKYKDEFWCCKPQRKCVRWSCGSLRGFGLKSKDPQQLHTILYSKFLNNLKSILTIGGRRDLHECLWISFRKQAINVHSIS